VFQHHLLVEGHWQLQWKGNNEKRKCFYLLGIGGNSGTKDDLRLVIRIGRKAAAKFSTGNSWKCDGFSVISVTRGLLEFAVLVAQWKVTGRSLGDLLEAQKREMGVRVTHSLNFSQSNTTGSEIQSEPGA